jgi:hypothetical protein
MALTYEESSALMNDTIFRGRVKVSCLKYAKYILNEPTITPAHTTRVRWAQNVVQSPDAVASQMTPAVVMQDPVQAQGSAISDVDLQTAVETVINEIM